MSLKVSSSPHIRHADTTRSIMLDVLIALMPAAIAGVFYFGINAALCILVSVASCILFEFLWQKFVMRKKSSIDDLSAAVTGLLLAMNMPPSIHLWMVVAGAFFAIIIVKQLFGGIGNNFVNPAMAARAFMMSSWPVCMTHWQIPFKPVDAVSTPTVLANLTPGGELPLLSNLFLGKMAGCIGETCAAMLLVGGIYLVIKRVIKPTIPVCFIGTVFLFMLAAGGSGFALAQILSGGLFLGAIFMATDYVTSPVTHTGHIIMGVGCGIIASVIRLFGTYPEGVTYAILFMNCLVPLIDKFTKPVVYGSKGVKNE